MTRVISCTAVHERGAAQQEGEREVGYEEKHSTQLQHSGDGQTPRSVTKMASQCDRNISLTPDRKGQNGDLVHILDGSGILACHNSTSPRFRPKQIESDWLTRKSFWRWFSDGNRPFSDRRRELQEGEAQSAGFTSS